MSVGGRERKEKRKEKMENGKWKLEMQECSESLSIHCAR